MSQLISDLPVGVVGGGNMAKAILTPLIEKGLLCRKKVIVSATSATTLQYWKDLGCQTTLDNGKLVRESHYVIWAVKPQLFPNVIKQTGEALGRLENVGQRGESKLPTLHISIMAAISMETFGNSIAENLYAGQTNGFRIIRTMPNIGVKVACGVVVFSVDPNKPSEDDAQFISNIFTPLGVCFQVEESKINAYAALFGSAIGFMFPVIEALSDGAVKVGIPRANSLKIAAYVMKGAGELLLQENCHPGTLKDMVCSPGGTTIAGIAELERGGVRASFINAIEATTRRGIELEAASTSAQK